MANNDCRGCRSEQAPKGRPLTTLACCVRHTSRPLLYSVCCLAWQAPSPLGTTVWTEYTYTHVYVQNFSKNWDVAPDLTESKGKIVDALKSALGTWRKRLLGDVGRARGISASWEVLSKCRTERNWTSGSKSQTRCTTPFALGVNVEWALATPV